MKKYYCIICSLILVISMSHIFAMETQESGEKVQTQIQEKAEQESEKTMSPLAGKLLKAIDDEDTKVIAQYLEKGNDVNAIIDNETLLIHAAQKGKLSVVKFLLEHGANINAANESGFTPLMAAIASGHMDVLEELLAHGADIKAMTNDGETALTFAAFTGNIPAIRQLLSKGADINEGGKYAMTPLMAAAIEDQLKAVKELLLNHAKVMTVNNMDQTAYHLAKQAGKKQVADFLLRYIDAQAQVLRLKGRAAAQEAQLESAAQSS
jgi:ankyrin repeat protein